MAINQLSAADRRYLASLKTNETEKEAAAAGITLGEAKTVRLRVGMEITGQGTATGIVGIVPVPMDWPEQTVRRGG